MVSTYAGLYSESLRDLDGNALVGIAVTVKRVGETDPATLYMDPDRAAELGNAPIPAAAGLVLPGIDEAGNVTFYADWLDDDGELIEYNLTATWQGNALGPWRVRLTTDDREPPLPGTVTMESLADEVTDAIEDGGGVPDASVTNAKVAAGAAIAESKLSLASDAAAGTASRRTLGTSATSAAAGNDPRLSDTRVPADNTVTTAKIANGAVTAAKVASDVATQAELDAAQTAIEVLDDAVTTLTNAIPSDADLAYEDVAVVPAAGTSRTLAVPTTATRTDLTLSAASCAITPPAAVAGANISVWIRGNGTRATTWTGVTWLDGGSAPAPYNGLTIVALSSDGTTWYGASSAVPAHTHAQSEVTGLAAALSTVTAGVATNTAAITTKVTGVGITAIEVVSELPAEGSQVEGTLYVVVDSAPAAPTGLAGTPGDAFVTWDWNDSGEADLHATTPYDIRVGTTNPPVTSPVVRAVSNYTSTALTNGTTYYAQVRARDVAGNVSAWSTAVSATPVDVTAPGTPTGLSASPGNTIVALNWADNPESDLHDTQAYDYRFGTSNPPAGSPVALLPSSANVTGLTNDTTYWFQVRARDVAGNVSAWSAAVSATPAAADVTRPTVTIEQAAGQADPGTGSEVNFTVVFSEVVTGFATGDVTLSGTAGATTGTVTGSGSTYNVAVTGMTGAGTVIATIAANVAIDGAGNLNFASTSTDNTVTWSPSTPVRVQNKPQVDTASTTHTVTYNSTPTPGNLGVIMIEVFAGVISTVTPPAGWTAAGTLDRGTSFCVGIYYRVFQAGDGAAVTFTTSGSVIAEMEALEYSGVSILDKIITTDGGAGTVTTLQIATTGTLAAANEVAVAVLGRSGSGASPTVDSGFALVDSATLVRSKAAEKITTATTALSPSFGWTTARTAAGITATFR